MTLLDRWRSWRLKRRFLKAYERERYQTVVLPGKCHQPTPAVPRTSASPVEFYEVDEPAADVQAAFDAGEKHTTQRPAS